MQTVVVILLVLAAAAQALWMLSPATARWRLLERLDRALAPRRSGVALVLRDRLVAPLLARSRAALRDVADCAGCGRSASAKPPSRQA